MSAAERVIVLRDLGLGDLLAAIPALRAIAAAWPGATRGLVVHPRNSALVELVTAGRSALRPYRCLLSATSLGLAPEIGIDLHGNGPLSHGWVLESRPRRFLGFAHPDCPQSARCPRWRAGEHEIVRWCRLLAESGIAADPRDLDIELPESLVARRRRSPGPTIVHPGASAPARRWPAERFAEVVRAEILAGREVLITGSESERALATAIGAAAGLESNRVLAGMTDIGALASLAASAERIVCGDTGLAHLATALGVPSVVLFGPVAPAEWGPPAERWWHRSLSHGAGGGDPHGEIPDPRLLAIEAEEVIAALAELPPRAAVPRAQRSREMATWQASSA